MAGYKKPSWMTKGFSLRAKLQVGSAPYNPGSFEPRYVDKPTGDYNPGGGYENRDISKPTGKYAQGGFQARAVARPSGAYNPGAFEDREGDSFDPWGAHMFSLELDGQEIGQFLEASGMKTTTTVLEIEEGGMNGRTHKRPGQSKWENLVLRQGECDETALIAWRDAYLQDNFGTQKKTLLAIVLRDLDGMEIRRYDVVRPWPVSWEGASLNAGGSDLAIHTVEVAHEGILLDGGGQQPIPDPPKPEPPDKFETEPIQFNYNESTLTEDGQRVVDDLNKEIAEHDVEEIWVEGHTCNMGSHSYNQGLSEARAATVAEEIRKKNPGVTVHSAGYSYDHPAASNSTDAGRRRNRRTEVWTSARSGRRPGELK